MILGEDVADPEGGGVIGTTNGLSTRFGDARVRSTPISEQAIIGAAIGASLAGYKPVAEIMLMNFTTVAMDMIFNHAAKLRYMSGGQTSVPIVIRTMTGAGFSTGGQHSDYFEAWFAHTAGLKVVMPATAEDAYGLLRSAIDDPDPVIFIENTAIYWVPMPAPAKGHRVPIGKARIAAEGTDLTIVTYSSMVRHSLAVACRRWPRPASAPKSSICGRSRPGTRKQSSPRSPRPGAALIVHEAVQPFGVGAEIAAVVGEQLLRQAEGAGRPHRRHPSRRCRSRSRSRRPSCRNTRSWHRGRPSAIQPRHRRPTDMATEILLPKIGFAMNEGELKEWLIEDGQPVTAGDLLFVLEADKSANEVESPPAGTVQDPRSRPARSTRSARCWGSSSE